MTDFEELLKILPGLDDRHLLNSLSRLARIWKRELPDIINLAFLIASDRDFSTNVIAQLRNCIRFRLRSEDGIRHEGLSEEITAPENDPNLDDYGFSDEEILIIAERVKGTSQKAIAEKMGVSPRTIYLRLKKIAKKICL